MSKERKRLRHTALLAAVLLTATFGSGSVNAQDASAPTNTAPAVTAPSSATPPSSPAPAVVAPATPAAPAVTNAAPVPAAQEPTPSAPAPMPNFSASPAASDVTTPAATSHDPNQVPVVAVPVASAAPAHNPNKPHDLSPWGMFMQADVVVKAVMLGLLSASLVCWTVWLAKTVELTVAKRRLRAQLRKLAEANSLGEAASLVGSARGAVPTMLQAAIFETRASWDITDKHSIKERIEARLNRCEFAAGRDINRGTGILATIGSTSPFIGLFGTVWGIMNSFIGISEAQTTNLAIVAPGIAEALLATAFGLVAAIPAVIIYNHFSRSIGAYKALVGDASVLVLGLVSRDYDRGVRPELRAAE
jgi:biopolymer transport protein ExbB